MKGIWLRLGRDDSINWIVISVVCTLQFVGSFVITNAQASGKELLFVGCVVVSVLVVAAMLLVTRYVVIPRVPVYMRPPVILVMFELTALARAFVFNGLLISNDLSSDDMLLSRIYGSQFNIFVAGVIVSALVSMARDFSESNQQLVRTLEELNAAQEETESRLKQRRLGLISSIKAQLEASLSQLTGVNLNYDADKLRSLIDNVVRPISHKLGREFESPHETTSAPTVAFIKWSVVIRYALESNPIHPIWLTLWTACNSLQVIVLAAGIDFLFPYLSAVLGFALWFTGSRYLWGISAHKLSRPIRAVLFSSLMLGTPLAVTFVLERQFDLELFNTRVVVAAALYFFVMAWSVALVTAVATLLSKTNKELVSATGALRRRVISDNVSARHFEQAVSQVLHGPIQDAVAASLKRIQSLQPDSIPGDTEGDIIRHHIEEALQLMNETESRYYSVERGVKDLANLWSGVVNIEVACDESTTRVLNTAQTTSSIAIEVIREAVSNAIRHGDATHIKIWIALSDENSDVSITVTNNGKALLAESTAGIGTKLLDDMTLTWSRKNDKGFVKLSAVLPLQQS